jgi:hypothetical protein
MSMFKPTLIALGALALTAGAASADIVIVSGSVPQNPDENVMLSTGAVGTTVFGTTNQTNSSVTFVGSESLTEPSNGQARIEASDGSFTTLEFFLTDPLLTFTSAEFNINALSDGMITINATDDGGSLFSMPFAISAAGQNFFNLTGINGQSISNVSFTSTGQIADVRQIRLGGVAGLTSVVPEPASWAVMILGFGMIGAGLRLRRRRDEATPA